MKVMGFLSGAQREVHKRLSAQLPSVVIRNIEKQEIILRGRSQHTWAVYECRLCKAEFEALKSLRAKGGAVYCSKKCAVIGASWKRWGKK